MNKEIYEHDVRSATDITLLDMTVGEAKFAEFMEYAITKKFKTVCVPSCRVEMAAGMIKKNEHINIAATAGFPFGHGSLTSKLKEFDIIKEFGGAEVDVVPDFIHYIDGYKNQMLDDLTNLVKHAHNLDLVIKIIIETSRWEFYDIITLTKLVRDSGANFVKTSSGMSKAGAKITDVENMARIMPTKASGGIRSMDSAKKFIEAGAKRLGIGFSACQEVFHRHHPYDFQL